MASSQALEDPLILNDITPIKVFIDYKPDAKSGPYWHRYLMQFADSEIKPTVEQFSKLMKYGWYSIFWSEDTVYVVFTDKIFKLPREKVWKSDKYQELREYAFTHGSEPRYFDFNERFAHYAELLKKYKTKVKFKPNHAAFTVNNIEESVAWYQKNLGFKVTHQYNKYGSGRAIIELDDVRIELFDFGEETKPLPDYRKDLMEDLHVVGIKHLCIEVENLDEMISSLKKKGLKDIRKVDTAGFGGRFTFIKDCNGILVELYEPEQATKA